jgi:hypothetical protein
MASHRRKTKSKKKSNKGALIKGMSKALPLELLRDRVFEDGLNEIMRGYAGVYALYNKKKLYYVGLATNLYARIRGHTKNKHKHKWDSFAIFRINRVRYLKDIETLLLRVSKPPGNSVSGHLQRNADFTRVLRRVHSEQVRRLRKLRRVFV